MAQHLQGLSGRTVLVTGGARRLGRAVVLRLAASGAEVVIHYRSSATEAAELVEDIGFAGGKAWAIEADLDRSDEAEGLIPRVLGQVGRLDCLVNNASIFPADTLAHLTGENLVRNVRVNALAPFVLTRALAGQGRAAAVVDLLDTRMVDYDRQHVSYHLSKRMLYTFTRMCAIEYAPAVRVNGVAPGLILPPAGQGPDYLADLAHTNPMRTHGEPDDVCDAVEFLLTAPFVTGQVIYVDGGRHLYASIY